ncbi:MAG: class I SAM-dependent methyltransferase [Solirubrobacteraceae bacterium]
MSDSTSLVYRSAQGYELVMRVLYGRHYGARLRAVAEQVPAGSSVLELCPGPGALYRRYLRGRAGAYTGADVNPGFVDRLRRLGATAVVLELPGPDPLPEADVVIMQASLYHFLPGAETIVERMLGAARERVIVAEPIRNLSSSRLPWLAALGRRGTDPGGRGESGAGHEERFDEPALDRLMAAYGEAIVTAFTIPGGREKVFVLDPRRPWHPQPRAVRSRRS